MLYRRNANTRWWKGCVVTCEWVSHLECECKHRKQAHLRYEPRARISTGRRKVHGWGERVLGDGHGWISVNWYGCRRLTHLIFDSGGTKETARGPPQKTQRDAPKSGMNRVGDSDHLAPSRLSVLGSISPIVPSWPPVRTDVVSQRSVYKGWI